MTALETPKPPVPVRTTSRPRTIKWGDVLVAAIGLVIAIVLFIGSANMEVRGQSVPGPQFFPILVGVLLTATSGFLIIRALIPAKRVQDHEDLRPDISRDLLIDVGHTETQLSDLENVHKLEAAQREAKAHAAQQTKQKEMEQADEAEGDFDFKAVSITVISVAAFIILLKPIGWILAAMLLFAAICYAFGSKRIIFNLAIGLFIGAVVQIVFSGLLGLSLPAGFLGGIF